MGDFMERMVELANGIHSDLVALPDDHARYDLVKQIIDSAEIVFAVWTDRFAEDGVGHMLVKGQAISRQAVADNMIAAWTRIAAIPCTAQGRRRHCCTNSGNGIADTDLLAADRQARGWAHRRLQFHRSHPYMWLMTSWKPTPRAPAKTKEELREMLAQAVPQYPARNRDQASA